jgi:WD40 repeat protein
VGHTDFLSSVVFHPDDHRIASANQDGTVRIWDVVNGLEVLRLHGHASPVRGLAFSPEGHYLAGACTDGTVQLWNGSPR